MLHAVKGTAKIKDFKEVWLSLLKTIALTVP
jgi:hypothetical protein